MTPPFLTSPLLEGIAGVRHGFFTRRGGVSGGVYEGLNVGVGSRDDPAAVAHNRRLAAQAFGDPAPPLITGYQVHSARALTTDGPWPGDPPQADAVVTTQPGMMLGALAADCAPILIADGAGRVAGAVHAGWRGALAGIAEAAIEAMVEAGAQRERLVAAVGPCIGPASYEVGLEFLDAFVSARPDNARFFQPGATPAKRLFDLPTFVLSRLAEAGVTRAEWIGRDTCAEAEDFFSNRRALQRGEADYGRLLSAIMLE
ncbi:MAG: peptidoglycan editing factor PgeF [Caulobacteraceae bacterium]|nr:peptidoglycan editing factor PgeF [Caulobacteraceae bacterium]